MGKGLTLLTVALLAAGCGTQERPENSASSPIAGEFGARTQLVSDGAAFDLAVSQARPGDTIRLKNGVWRDFDMVVHGVGLEGAPIRVEAETPGGVILSGQSSLRLGGEYLVVSGLVFRDGYTPRKEVISFRRDSDTVANNSRVTDTVIENYSNPDRAQTDIWVALYGRNNVFDHNYLAGKVNAGVTMAVRLDSEESRNNSHIIRANYFGPRPIKGSNGGETLRIGTSHFSLTHSGTLVEGNFFERCSGEVEIVSNKSGGNVYRGNTFLESRGTLTLRHGSGTLVENNLFDGKGAPYTGGVRVINGQQTVRNNYFKDLTGERFSGALVVMNGVPNSPINRYHQVEDAIIENNTFDGVAAIELGEGADSERSAAPAKSVFRNNIVHGDGTSTPFNLYDDMSGIEFSSNLTGANPPASLASGFKISSLKSDIAPLLPHDGIGATGPFGISRDETGPEWFTKPDFRELFEGGREVRLSPGENKLSEAIASAVSGDTLILAPGRYNEATISNVQIPITIRAEGGQRPVIAFDRANLFLLSGWGALRLENLEFTGERSPDFAGNSVISTDASIGSGNHVAEIEESVFRDMKVNRGFSIVSAKKGTFFDAIRVSNSAFQDVSGTPFKLDVETDDFGVYNVEYLQIDNSDFERIGGPVIDVYRGGRDESTFGPHVWVSSSTFSDVGGGSAPLMKLYGVQNLKLVDNHGTAVAPVKFTITTGKPVQEVSGNQVSGDRPERFMGVTDLRD